MFSIGENVGETSSLNIFEFILPLLVQIFGKHTAINMSKLKKKIGPAISALGIYLVYVLAKSCLDMYTRMFTKYCFRAKKKGGGDPYMLFNKKLNK